MANLQDPNSFYMQNMASAPPDMQASALDQMKLLKLAEALRAQAISPIDSSQIVHTGGGQWAAPDQIVPVGIGQGLTKLGQGWLAGSMEKDAQQKQLDLANQLRNMRATETNDLMRAANGVPSQDLPEGFMPKPDAPVMPDLSFDTSKTPDYANMLPAREATPKATPQELAAMLTQSSFPDRQKFGEEQLMAGVFPKQTEPFSLSEGGARFDAQGKLIAQNPKAPPILPQTDVQKLIDARDKLPEGSPDRVILDAAIKKATYIAPEKPPASFKIGELRDYQNNGKKITEEYTDNGWVQKGSGPAWSPNSIIIADRRLAADKSTQFSDAERVSAGAQVAAGQPLSQVMPGYGKSAVADRKAVRQEAINQIKAQTGMSDIDAGGELAARSIGFSADKSSTNQLTKMEGATIPIVKQLHYNVDKATDILKNIGDRDISPVINAVADGAKVWSGDPRFASLFFHMQGAAIEAAKLRSGGQASVAQLNVSAMEEAKKWADMHMTPATWADVSQAMKAEGDEKLKYYKEAADYVKRRGGGSTESPAKPPMPEKTINGVTYVHDGNGWKRK